MKKIYWLHTHLLFPTGGTRYIFEVVRQLRKHYEIEIYVEQSSSEWEQKFDEIGVKVHKICPLTSTSPVYWIFFPIFLLSNFLALKKAIRKSDIVISTMFPMQFLASLLSSRTLYFCFEPFAFFYDKDLIRFYSILKRALLNLLAAVYSLLDQLGTKRSSILLTINPSVGKWINRIYGRTPEGFSYLGVDVDYFKPSQQNTKKESISIFHSTDFTPLKGTRYLCEALSLVLKKHRNLTVTISETVENPKEKAELAQLLEKNQCIDQVQFVGHLSYQDLPKYYQSSDIYVFSGDPASTGATAASLSVLEASAAGLAIVRSVGNDDEVVPGLTGVMIDPRNTSELSHAIESLVSNPQRMRQMGKAGREHVLKTYTWDEVAKEFYHWIERL